MGGWPAAGPDRWRPLPMGRPVAATAAGGDEPPPRRTRRRRGGGKDGATAARAAAEADVGRAGGRGAKAARRGAARAGTIAIGPYMRPRPARGRSVPEICAHVANDLMNKSWSAGLSTLRR